MKYFISIPINIINWLIFYNPSYIVGNIVLWVKNGYRDGKASDYMK